MILFVRKFVRPTVAAGAVFTAVLALSACAAGVTDDAMAGLPDYAKADPTGYRPDEVSDQLSSADSDQNEEGFQRCPEASSDPASTNNYQTICTYLDNNAQVFTAPNQLGAATYSEYTNNLPWPQWTNSAPVDDLGNSWLWSTQGCNPWGQRSSALPNTASMSLPPATFSKLNTSTQLAGAICSPGSIARISYMPPAPLPAYDIFELQMLPWNGSRAWKSTNGGQCSNGKYTDCKVTHVGNGYWSANYVYSINNYPVTIQLDNNLNSGNTMKLSGAPRTANFILDPAGGNPTKIGAGTSGYFGGYARTPVAGSNPSSSSSPSPSASSSVQAPITDLDASGFSAVYTVGGSGDMAGAQFVIQVAIDPNTRQLAEGSVCIPIAATTTQNPICTPQLVGAAGSPQTIVLNFSE